MVGGLARVDRHTDPNRRGTDRSQSFAWRTTSRANGSITITSLASLSVMRSDSFTGAHGEYAVEYLETLCVLHPCLCHFMRHGAVYIRAVPLQLSHAQWHGADMCRGVRDRKRQRRRCSFEFDDMSYYPDHELPGIYSIIPG